MKWAGLEILQMTCPPKQTSLKNGTTSGQDFMIVASTSTTTNKTISNDGSNKGRENGKYYHDYLSI